MTKTILTAKSLINGQWATFKCENDKYEITVKHPDGNIRVIEYRGVRTESDLTVFAYGYCYGYESR